MEYATVLVWTLILLQESYGIQKMGHPVAMELLLFNTALYRAVIIAYNPTPGAFEGSESGILLHWV